MGPMERRERQRQELRKRILDTARRLFAEEGYDAVTMRTIAHEIEYSPRTIYLHFKDKEELFRSLCQEDFKDFGERLGPLLKVKDPLERMRAIGQAYARFAQAFPHHYQLMFMSRHPVHEDPSNVEWLGNPQADAYALLVGSVREALEGGYLRPELTDVDLVAQTAWAAIHGVMALATTQEGDPFVPWRPIEARVDAALDLVTVGLRRSDSPQAKRRK